MDRNASAIRSGDYRLVEFFEDDSIELYNLAKDIGETNDLAASHPDVLDKLIEYAEKSHEPVRPGVFSDRTRHEQDERQ